MPERHPQVAAATVNLASARKELGRLAEAEDLYRRGTGEPGGRLGLDHPRGGGGVQRHRRGAGAAGSARRVRDTVPARGGDRRRGARGRTTRSRPSTRPTWRRPASRTGSARRGELIYRQSLAAARAALGDRHPIVAEILRGSALVEASLGRPQEAEGRTCWRPSPSARRCWAPTIPRWGAPWPSSASSTWRRVGWLRPTTPWAGLCRSSSRPSEPITKRYSV